MTQQYIQNFGTELDNEYMLPVSNSTTNIWSYLDSVSAEEVPFKKKL